MAKGEVEPAWIPPARPPGGWAVAQRELPTHLANGERLPETPVRVQWWTNDLWWWPFWSNLYWTLVGLFLRVRRGPVGTWVALWRRESPAEEPDLMFLTDPAQLPSTEGTAYGTAIGEYAPNGALLVQLDGRRIVPTHNPQRPYGDMTRHLRS